MSEHRRKQPPSQGGGRAAARRGGQQPSGRRAAPQRGTTGSVGPAGEERTYGGRAEARRAAQRSGGGRRRAAVGHDGGGRGGRGRAAAREPERKRLIDYPRSGRYGFRRWVPSWKQVLGSAVVFFGLIVGGAGIALALVEKPNPNEAAEAQSNVYYWSDGTQMASTGGEVNRQIVPITSIPKSMQDAVISAENATFYDDSGVDPMGIARAVFNMARGGSTQSGSTITQQYVKNAMLSQEQTLTRKAKELFISIKVGATEPKDKILAGYLNTAYYGRGAYGIQAAAQAYYGKDCDKLTASEGAFLSATLNGPNLYDPAGGIGDNASKAANTKRAKDRWAWTLGREVSVGRMSAAQRDKYIQQGFPKPKDPKMAKGLSGQNGYLVETAQKYVLKKRPDLTPDDLSKGGFQIHTTFNKSKTEALEKSVRASRKQYLDAKKRDEDKSVQFGGASVDPNNGKIVALYGGEGYDQSHFNNNADTSGVPVGSTWKPYVLAAAMEYGTLKSDGQGISPQSKYNGNDMLPIKDRNGELIRTEDGQPFRQKNESPTRHGYITLEKAMEQSVNTPFVQLGIDVGLQNVQKVAESTGILKDSMDRLNASFSIGTSTPSAIRMADSYGTFATSGVHVEPYSVTKVEQGGQELDGFEKPKSQQAMTNNVANNVTKVLENVIQNGTAKKARALERAAAGKTGTTDKNKSAWFVGYTKQLSTAVTMFRTDPEHRKLLSMNGTGGFDSIHGGAIPTEIWTDYMKAALKGTPDEPFPAAEPIGSKVDQDGAPTPTPTPSDTPTQTPSETPSETPSSTPPTSPSPSPTCGVFDPNCEPGGANGGDDGTDAGADGGTDSGTSGTPTPPSGGGGNGNSNGGGLFGGPTSTRRE
ncbi:transglycosylase domain-containing protein [Streptomyces sp. 8N706]|uniref:transglycosylase domain-containing protein n=1 Tax=Streptomyces sp. 8N706 TaxID=3457416 RepID=UPI003FD5A4B1